MSLLDQLDAPSICLGFSQNKDGWVELMFRRTPSGLVIYQHHWKLASVMSNGVMPQ
jgi:hypothetical protein